MKKRITVGLILSRLWIIVLLALLGWGLWDKWREKVWLIVLGCIILAAGAYFSMRSHNEKMEKERQFRKYKSALYRIATDAREKKIQSMAYKVLFDESYDPDF